MLIHDPSVTCTIPGRCTKLEKANHVAYINEVRRFAPAFLLSNNDRQIQHLSLPVGNGQVTAE